MVTENPSVHIITNTGFFEDYSLIDKVMEVSDLGTSLNFSFLSQMASRIDSHVPFAIVT